MDCSWDNKKTTFGRTCILYNHIYWWYSLLTYDMTGWSLSETRCDDNRTNTIYKLSKNISLPTILWIMPYKLAYYTSLFNISQINNKAGRQAGKLGLLFTIDRENKVHVFCNVIVTIVVSPNFRNSGNFPVNSNQASQHNSSRN